MPGLLLDVLCQSFVGCIVQVLVSEVLCHGYCWTYCPMVTVGGILPWLLLGIVPGMVLEVLCQC